MQNSVYLTVIVLMSLSIPNLINLVTQKFSVIEAELKYYEQEQSGSVKNSDLSLMDCLKSRYIQTREQLLASSSSAFSVFSFGNSSEPSQITLEEYYYSGTYDGIEVNQQVREIDGKLADVLAKFVSKTSKNWVMADVPSKRVFLVSADNRFQFSENLSTQSSYVSIMSTRDSRLFSSKVREHLQENISSSIKWHLCRLHHVPGIIKDIQFDVWKQSFIVHYTDALQQNQRIRLYEFKEFCDAHPASWRDRMEKQEVESNRIRSDSEKQRHDQQFHSFSRMHRSKGGFAFEDLIRSTRNTYVDAVNYDEIELNRENVHRIAFNNSTIIYSSSSGKYLMQTLLLTKSQEGENMEVDKRGVSIPNYSYIDKDYVQVLHIQLVESESINQRQFIVILLKGNHEEVFVECEIFRISNFAEDKDDDIFEEDGNTNKFDSEKIYRKINYMRENTQTLFSKNMTEFIRSVDIFSDKIFPTMHTAYNKFSQKMVVNILNQHLMLLDLSAPQTVGIVDIQPPNFWKFVQGGYTIQKMAFSQQGSYLCILAQDENSSSQIFILEISKNGVMNNSVSPQDVFLVKEIRDRIKYRVIKDFSTYESETNPQQLNSILLLEGGEVVRMSLCSNCSNELRRSVVKELMEIMQTLFISILVLLLLFSFWNLITTFADSE